MRYFSVFCLLMATGYLCACGGGGSASDSADSDNHSATASPIDNVSDTNPSTITPIDTSLKHNPFTDNSASLQQFNTATVQLDLQQYSWLGDIIVLKITDPDNHLLFIGQINPAHPILLDTYINADYDSVQYQVYSEHPQDTVLQGEVSL